MQQRKRGLSECRPKVRKREVVKTYPCLIVVHSQQQGRFPSKCRRMRELVGSKNMVVQPCATQNENDPRGEWDGTVGECQYNMPRIVAADFQQYTPRLLFPNLGENNRLALQKAIRQAKGRFKYFSNTRTVHKFGGKIPQP